MNNNKLLFAAYWSWIIYAVIISVLLVTEHKKHQAPPIVIVQPPTRSIDYSLTNVYAVSLISSCTNSEYMELWVGNANSQTQAIALAIQSYRLKHPDTKHFSMEFCKIR